MSRARTSLKWIALVAFVAIATVSIGAQQVARRAEPAAAAKSYALQTRLAAIEQDKATAVNQLLAEWQGYVDSNVYDLQAEFGEAALNVPAWQIYGASLVGDLRTALRVLGGIEGAGKYINTLNEPQQKVWQSGPMMVGPKTLGSATDNLVYAAIVPCRMVDTRGSGARTGMMVPGVARTFDLTTGGFVKGQGGATSGCTGLPSFSPTAWAVNIAVTGYTAGAGYLTAWPFGSAEPPNGAVINYQSSPYALSTGQTLTGCWGCADDIIIKAYTASTHVIIDVVGYYQDASVTNAVVTKIAGTPVTNTNVYNFIVSAACPAGSTYVSSEMDHNGLDVAVGEFTAGGTGIASFWMINNGGGSVTYTAYSNCQDTPIRVF